MNRIRTIGLLTAGILVGVVIAISMASRGVPQRFVPSLSRLIVHEGCTYENHPADRGGPTKCGITLGDVQRFVDPAADWRTVRDLPREKVNWIYREKYWLSLGVRGDDQKAGLDYILFDYGVNSGVARSGKVLRRVLKLPDDDWRISADVLRAANARGPLPIIRAICVERAAFFEAIIRNNPSQEVFRRGWERRNREVCANAQTDAGMPRVDELRPTAPTAAEPMGKAMEEEAPQ